MEEIVIVVLIRRDDPSSGFGFSLLDKPGFPPVIYDIEEDSPAAESGNVEAGDVILKINEVDVGKYSIKEVLKCLRLAGNHVSLKLKRDPVLKKEILLYLSTSGENVENDLVNRDEVPLTNGNGMVHTVESRKKDPALQPSFVPLQDITSYRKFDNELASNPPANNTAPPSQPMFEAYVMTGERLLKLTKNTSLAPKYQRKIDSLKSQNHCRNVFDQHFKIKSTPSSPVELEGSLTDVKSSSACMFPVTVETSESADSTPDSPEQRVSPSFLVNISKSDDLIQYKNTVSVSSISVQVDDEDIRLSLHALLDTGSDHHKTEDKRVQCTYNDPEPTIGGSSSTIPSSEIVLSRPFISLPLPTEVSFPLMSTLDSSSVDHKRLRVLSFWNNNSIDSSQVEMLSNISSPDYREETSDMLNVNDVGSEVIDQSDSDSSLLVSEPKIRRLNKCVGLASGDLINDSSNRANVIKVSGEGIVWLRLIVCVVGVEWRSKIVQYVVNKKHRFALLHDDIAEDYNLRAINEESAHVSLLSQFFSAVGNEITDVERDSYVC